MGNETSAPRDAPSELPDDSGAELPADLEALVTCESPSADLAAVARSAEVVAAIGARRFGLGPLDEAAVGGASDGITDLLVDDQVSERATVGAGRS